MLRLLNEERKEEAIVDDQPQPNDFDVDDEVEMDAFLKHHPNRKYFDADGEIDLHEYGRMVNAIVWLEFMASPKLWAALPRVPPKAHLLTLLDGFVPYAYSQRYAGRIEEGETRPDTSQRGPLTTRLRELVAAWQPPDLTAEIRETALLLLLANGSKEPPGGVDEFTLGPDFPYEQMILGPDGFNEG